MNWWTLSVMYCEYNFSVITDHAWIAVLECSGQVYVSMHYVSNYLLNIHRAWYLSSCWESTRLFMGLLCCGSPKWMFLCDRKMLLWCRWTGCWNGICRQFIVCASKDREISFEFISIKLVSFSKPWHWLT